MTSSPETMARARERRTRKGAQGEQGKGAHKGTRKGNVKRKKARVRARGTRKDDDQGARKDDDRVRARGRARSAQGGAQDLKQH